MTDRMTEEEFDQMRALIKRFAESELDQFALWRTTTKFGPVYISIKRIADPGASDDAYDPL
jgi:hypothetical protein